MLVNFDRMINKTLGKNFDKYCSWANCYNYKVIQEWLNWTCEYILF